MMKESASKVQILQEALRDTLENLCNDVKAEVANIPPLDGVNSINDTSLHARTVSSKAIFNSGRCILAPSYYIPQAQAKAVVDVLVCPNLSLETFIRRLEEMIQNKTVKRKEYNVPLNPNTLEYRALMLSCPKLRRKYK